MHHHVANNTSQSVGTGGGGLLCKQRHYFWEEDIRAYYKIGSAELGKGSCGVVRKCVHRQTGEEFALKTVRKSNENALRALRRECLMMERLYHPNILCLDEVYEDQFFLHLVTELCQGGTLAQQHANLRRRKRMAFTELQAEMVARKMLDAVAYLHERGIAHCDMKPENIVVPAKAGLSKIKLIDFGLSQRLEADTTDEGALPLASYAGTASYIAPEVYTDQGYGCKVDCWAIGIILYEMIAGYCPFEFESKEKRKQRYRKIMNSPVYFPDAEWAGVTPEMKSFILSLLEKRAGARPTAEEALAHPWLCRTATIASISLFRSGGESLPQLPLASSLLGSSFVQQRLLHYLSLCPLQKAALALLATLVPPEEHRRLFSHLSPLFAELDLDSDGVITAEDLLVAAWAASHQGPLGRKKSHGAAYYFFLEGWSPEQLAAKLKLAAVGPHTPQKSNNSGAPPTTALGLAELLVALSDRRRLLATGGGTRLLQVVFRRLDHGGKGFLDTGDVRPFFRSEARACAALGAFAAAAAAAARGGGSNGSGNGGGSATAARSSVLGWWAFLEMMQQCSSVVVPQ